MAVIGARPARSLPFGLGGPRRSRTHPAARLRSRYSAAARRLEDPAGVRGIVLVIAAIVCLALFYLSQSSHVAAIGYQIDSLDAELADAVAVQQQLVLEIGQARAPAVIEREALNRLRLRPIDATRIRFATPSPEPAD